jgi:DNA-binding transcriptional regulator YhcF (GntR family)
MTMGAFSTTAGPSKAHRIEPQYKYFSSSPEKLAYLRGNIHRETPPHLAALHTACASELSHVAVRVLLALVGHANEKNGYRVFPSRETLSKICGCSLGTVKRSLEELEEAGFINSRRGQQSSTREINIPSAIVEGISAELAILMKSRNDAAAKIRERFKTSKAMLKHHLEAGSDDSLAGLPASMEVSDGSYVSLQNLPEGSPVGLQTSDENPDGSFLKSGRLTGEPLTMKENHEEIESEQVALPLAGIAVNCHTIAWPGGVIAFPDLDAAAKRRNVDSNLIRKFAEVQIGLWLRNSKPLPEKPIKVIIDAFKDATKEKKKAEDLGTFLAKDWVIPGEWCATAHGMGLTDTEIETEAFKFHRHYTSQNTKHWFKRFKDWHERWVLWLERFLDSRPAAKQNRDDNRALRELRALGAKV